MKPEATYAQNRHALRRGRQVRLRVGLREPRLRQALRPRLRGTPVKVCTVIGFPLGATPSEGKALEARRAIREGAREIDMVIHIGALKSGDTRAVYEDIRVVAEVAREAGALLKVIIETSLLTDEEKIAACVAAKKARANFVKTSTGFAKGGATAHDVALMAEAVEHKLGVKASGGVGSAADARKMILAGATRIGASVGVKIVQEARGEATGKSSAKSAAYSTERDPPPTRPWPTSAASFSSTPSSRSSRPSSGTIAKGFLPIAGEASLIVESPPASRSTA